MIMAGRVNGIVLRGSRINSSELEMASEILVNGEARFYEEKAASTTWKIMKAKTILKKLNNARVLVKCVDGSKSVRIINRCEVGSEYVRAELCVDFIKLLKEMSH